MKKFDLSNGDTVWIDLACVTAVHVRTNVAGRLIVCTIDGGYFDIMAPYGVDEFVRNVATLKAHARARTVTMNEA